MISFIETPSELKMNVFTLSFQEDFEKAYIDDFFQKSLKHIRIALLIAIVFYDLFGILDVWAVPSVKYQFWFIRYAIMTPVFLGIILFSYSGNFKKFIQPTLVACLFLAGFGILVMIMIAPAPISYSYYAGILLVLIYGYTFLKIRFIWAALAGWLLVIAYVIITIGFRQTPFTILIQNNFFLITGNIFCMFASYSIEFYSRKDFVRAHLLEKDKNQFDTASHLLGKKVKEHTSQIEKTNLKLKEEITLRSMAEEALQKAYDTLEIRVKNRTTELVELNKKLTDEIKERKSVEDSLRESQAQLNATIECLPFEIFMIDINGRYTLQNSAIKKRWGNIIGKRPQDFVKDKNMVAAWENNNVRAFSGEVVKVEKEFKSDPYKGFYYSIIAPVYNEDQIQGIIGVNVDITDLKLAENALRASENRYRILVETMYDGLGIQDENGLFTYVNKRFCDILGYPYDEIIGYPVVDFLDESNRKTLEEQLNRRKQGLLNNYELTWKQKNGAEVHTIISPNILLDNDDQVKGFFAVITDITDRKQSEKALRDSEEKFRDLAELLPQTVYEMDINGTLSFVNRNAYKQFGLNQEDFDKGLNGFELIVPEDRDRARENAKKILRGDEKSFNEYTVRRKDGSTFPVLILTAPIFKEETPVGFRGIIIDITEQKQADEEKKKLEAQLQQAQKMEAIGTLAGGMAHDFNNLLMGIQGHTSLMIMNTDRAHPDFEHFAGIEELVKSAADLTGQLLGFARGGKYEVKPTDLNQLIHKTTDMFGRTKKEITIHKKYQKDIWAVDVDRPQIEQVLLNLYVNAWQAISGIGELYLQTENIILDERHAKVSGLDAGHYIKVSVTDTGSGIDEEILDKIFDPFFTTKEKTRGTGLGLASAYGIIRSHGGIINVRSTKGEGATFNIYLPKSGETIQKAKNPSEEILRGAGTILMVDDEKLVTDVGCQVLETLGYNVLLANSGPEAIDIYRENADRIDMVILDMVMPGLGGGDTYDRLKDINANVKVLLSSGYSIDGHAKTILDRGCNGFIQKPYNLKSLSNKLKEILSQ